MAWIGAAIAGGASLLGDAVSANNGGAKGQSWGTVERAEDQADAFQGRDTARQGAFLEGIAPSQGAAYNTIQNETYGQDTQRQIGRIQDESKQLGMSPWELTGSPGQAPSPSPVGPSQGDPGQNGQFMAQMAQSKMQQDTAIQTTAMNNATQVETAGIQAGANYANQNMSPAAKTQIAYTKAQTLLATVQKTATETTNIATVRKSIMDTAQSFFAMMPKTTFTGQGTAEFNKGAFLGVSGEVGGTVQYSAGANWDKLAATAGDKDAFFKTWNGLDSDAMSSVIKGIAEWMKKAETAIGGGNNTQQ